MAARRRPSKSRTPLDDRQQALLAEQEKLQQKMAQLNHVIKEAPRIKAARERAQREQLLADRHQRGPHRIFSHTVADPRFDSFSGPNGGQFRRRPLKAERRQTFLIFCGLVVLLALLVRWLLSVWHWQWPG